MVLYEEFRKVVLVQAGFENVDIFAVTISVRSAFQICIMRTEKKFRWVLFLIIGMESL